MAAWARHMMSPDLELRIWIATDGSEVIGVVPFVAETMARGRLRLLPPTTDLMYGTVPIVHPDRAYEVAEAIADDFAARGHGVDLASMYWLPEGSPWVLAFCSRLSGTEWMTMNMTQYGSPYTSIADGFDTWLGQRTRGFRREAARRTRRCVEEGFRLLTTVDPTEIEERLPQLQSLYRGRQRERGGEGYRFDDDMVGAIATACGVSAPGRFRLSVLEDDDRIIGASLALRAGTRLSGWITGYDPEWSRLAPGISAILESLDAGARAGCEIADFGVGDQPYKGALHDAAFALESVTWCRPRLARLLQLGSEPTPLHGREASAGAEWTVGANV